MRITLYFEPEKRPAEVFLADKKSADPRFGVLEHVGGETVGEVYLPPTPLRPGPPRRNRWAQFVYSEAIRILGPTFGAHGPNPATGGLRPTFASI